MKLDQELKKKGQEMLKQLARKSRSTEKKVNKEYTDATLLLKQVC